MYGTHVFGELNLRYVSSRFLWHNQAENLCRGKSFNDTRRVSNVRYFTKVKKDKD